VLALHADQIERYGGRGGVRDLPLLASAVAMPAATFSGSFLHESLTEMVAAYLFHIVRNHPFVDGNKRTGLMAAVAFLGLNGHRMTADDEEVFALVVGVAAGRVSKPEVAVFVKRHSSRRTR
jgi:death-on-curing protein